jgi:hypothetical protein
MRSGLATQIGRKGVRRGREFRGLLAYSRMEGIGGFPNFVGESGVLLFTQKDGYIEKVLDIKSVPDCDG